VLKNIESNYLSIPLKEVLEQTGLGKKGLLEITEDRGWELDNQGKYFDVKA